jgi:hypothetical protein
MPGFWLLLTILPLESSYPGFHKPLPYRQRGYANTGVELNFHKPLQAPEDIP